MLAAAWVLALPAEQQTGVMTRISATAPDAVFLVDGEVITGAAVFTWPAGSKHALWIATAQNGMSSTKTQYVFQHWSAPSGPLGSSSNSVTITADPAIAGYNADLTTEYAVSLIFFSCADEPCVSPGTVWVNQVAYSESGDAWAAAGSTVTLEASPNAGYVFAGWGQGAQPALFSMVLNQPTSVYPLFAPAREIQLLTSPDGLQVLADRATVTTPATLEWGWNTTHTLGAVSPQWDHYGRQWLLRSWSDGGALTHTYQMLAGAAAATVTAQFVPAVAVLLATNPPGLTLTADGHDAPSPVSLFWASGDTHTVTAPLHQYDSAGGPWAFRSWSNGAANQQSITVTDDQAGTGIRLTAAYDPLSRIRVESVPTGLALSVDGAGCVTPCEVERAPGSTVRITAPASFPIADGARLGFVSWEGYDGGGLTAAAGYHKITARYQTAYQLTLTTVPADSGAWQLAPASADGFFPAGSVINIGYQPSNLMKFRGWGGDLSGSSNPAALTMDAPHGVAAMLDRLPAPPPPPRVTTAAGETPASAVAPGSIASLFGSDLADSTAEGLTNPLPQSLAGATLECAGYLLPLLYVSTGQINFQVPGDLAPGPYRLELHRPNTPVTEVPFTVARNAPGLLLATHADGSPVTADSPAVPGEAIVLYGTGFGPLTPMPLDGFQVPSAPPYALADPVEVLLGDRALAPDSAGAAAGAVGLVTVVARIPEDLDTTTPASITVRSGGVSSNSLPLRPAPGK